MSPSKGIHLAIIPDGNRRWAQEHGLNPWKGHEQAIENFRSITDWCRHHPRISIFTVWCFSTENWKRDPKEISFLMTMLEDYFRKEREGFLREKTRFMHSGRSDRIPRSLAALLQEVEQETADQRAFTLHLAVDYGGKDEVVRAVQGMGNVSDVSEETIRSHLDHPELPDIDLIIRTSGEMRTSNFFLWQTTYTEWVFLDKFFPDVSVDDLEQALRTYDQRLRRYGA